VPAKRASGERLLERALEALSRGLTATGAPWMIIGGIAVIARGVRRFTTDIDAAVRGDAISVARLVKVLAAHRIVPRIAGAQAFARENLVLLMRHEPTGVDLDVSLAWSAFEFDALDASTSTAFGRVTVPMSTPADLIVFKAIAGRPRDLEDAAALLALYPDIDLAHTRARIAALAALALAPELVTAFDAMAARSTRGHAQRRTARARQRPAKRRARKR
jgi:hypothetical protein